MRHIRIVLAGSCLAAATLLTACGSSTGGSASSARVQVFNVLALSQAADFQVNGLPLSQATGLIKGQVSTGYSTQPALATNSFSAMDAGTSTVLASASFAVGTGPYSLFLAGVPGSTTHPPALFILQDNGQAPSSSSFSVRVINASPDAGPASFSLSTNKATWTNVGYESQGIYETLSPGTYTQSAVSASTAAVIAVGTSYPFQGGHIYSIVLYGSVANSTQAIMIHQDV